MIAISISDKGKRCGQSHGQAKLTDHEVELMRKLHESGYGYKRLAKLFEISRSQAMRIVRYERRVATVAWVVGVP